MVTATLSDGSRQAVDAAEADWESSDRAVTTVSEGVLTAVGAGNAALTVTFGGQSAEVAVSVRISLRTEGTVRVLYVLADGPPVPGRLQRGHHARPGGPAVVVPPPDRRADLLALRRYPRTLPFARTRGLLRPWSRVGEGSGDVQPCAPVEYGRESFIWVLYVDVEEACGEPHELGAGWNGITMMTRFDLEGMTNPGTFYFCDEGPYEDSVGSRIGGAGHELAHALANVRHPPGCEEGLPSCDPVFWSLMHLGYTTYPDTYLLTEDKELLLRSPPSWQASRCRIARRWALSVDPGSRGWCAAPAAFPSKGSGSPFGGHRVELGRDRSGRDLRCWHP